MGGVVINVGGQWFGYPRETRGQRKLISIGRVKTI